MKKILFFWIFCVGLANASTVNHVWIPFPGGPLETQCRAMWNEFDVKNNTKTVYFIKPGADGLVATQDMLNFQSSRKFMCGGSSQVVTNPLIHNESYIDRFEPLLQTAVNTMVWYVPNSNKAKDLPELVKNWKTLNRPINIGIFLSVHRGVVNYLEKTYDIRVNLINYRSGPQMYPDLSSGQLDLAFDSGGGIELATADKFRILGYIAPRNYKKLESYPNLNAVGSDMELYSVWLGVFVPSDLPAETKIFVSAELRNIIQQKNFKDLAGQNFSTVTAVAQPDITVLALKQRRVLEKNWK